MPFKAYLTLCSYIVYKMAEGLSARLPDLGGFSSIFLQIKNNFPLAGTLN